MAFSELLIQKITLVLNHDFEFSAELLKTTPSQYRSLGACDVSEREMENEKRKEQGLERFFEGLLDTPKEKRLEFVLKSAIWKTLNNTNMFKLMLLLVPEENRGTLIQSLFGCRGKRYYYRDGMDWFGEYANDHSIDFLSILECIPQRQRIEIAENTRLYVSSKFNDTITIFERVIQRADTPQKIERLFHLFPYEYLLSEFKKESVTNHEYKEKLKSELLVTFFKQLKVEDRVSLMSWSIKYTDISRNMLECINHDTHTFEALLQLVPPPQQQYLLEQYGPSILISIQNSLNLECFLTYCDPSKRLALVNASKGLVVQLQKQPVLMGTVLSLLPEQDQLSFLHQTDPSAISLIHIAFVNKLILKTIITNITLSNVSKVVESTDKLGQNVLKTEILNHPDLCEWFVQQKQLSLLLPLCEQDAVYQRICVHNPQNLLLVDKDRAIRFVREDVIRFQNVPAPLRDDIDIVQAACQHDPSNIQYTNDKIITTILSKKPELYFNLSVIQRKNSAFIQIACQKCSENVELFKMVCSESLQYLNLASRAVQHKLLEEGVIHFKDASPALRHDVEIARRSCHQDPKNIQHTSDKIALQFLSEGLVSVEHASTQQRQDFIQQKKMQRACQIAKGSILLENINYKPQPGRYHFFPVHSPKYTEQGDALKRQLLMLFASELYLIESEVELVQFKQRLSQRHEYEIIRQGQGILTWFLNLIWHLMPTSSECVLDQMIQSKEKEFAMGFPNSYN